MTITGILFLIAIILMVLGACPIPSKVDLFKLGWAFAIAAFAFGAVVH